MIKGDLDKRICDVEERAKNTQTYREFIRESEEFMGMPKADVDSMSDTKLTDYLDMLDDMWDK